VQSDDVGFYVLAVDAADKAALKRIKTDRLDGDAWIVTGGVATGDRIIVSGLQKARPGSAVKPIPWQPDAASAEAPAGGSGK
jgi:membrane fusion protein (multidrug efflux system)